MTVSLSPHLDALIEEQVATGRYADAAEVIAAGVRLLGQENDHQPPELNAFLADMDRRLAEANRGELVDADTVWSELEEDARIRQLRSS